MKKENCAVFAVAHKATVVFVLFAEVFVQMFWSGGVSVLGKDKSLVWKHAITHGLDFRLLYLCYSNDCYRQKSDLRTFLQHLDQADNPGHCVFNSWP